MSEATVTPDDVKAAADLEQELQAPALSDLAGTISTPANDPEVGAAPQAESETVAVDFEALSQFVPLIIPPAQDIVREVVAPVAAYGLQSPHREAFIRRLGENKLLEMGLKTLQVDEALRLVVKNILRGVGLATQGDAPALKPEQVLLAGAGAVVLAVVMERWGPVVVEMLGIGGLLGNLNAGQENLVVVDAGGSGDGFVVDVSETGGIG